MKLSLLFEIDASNRGFERAAMSGDPDALMRLAQSYLRTNDPRMKEIIEPLKKLSELDNSGDAKDIIKLWAEQNEIQTAEDFVLGLSRVRNGVDFEVASAEIEKAEFLLTFEDEIGRSGVAYGLEIWWSPAGGSVWLVWGSDEEERFNYGVVDEEDFAATQARPGLDDGALNFYRDYLD